MALQQNFFSLLDDDDNGDPSAVIDRAASPKAREKHAPGTKKQQQPPVAQQQQQQQHARLPSKPLPPAQAVREAQQSQYERGRVRGGRGGRGEGRASFANRERDWEGGFGRQGGEGAFRGGRGNYSDRNFGFNRDSSEGGRGGYYGGGGGGGPSGGFPADDGEGGRPFEGGRGLGRGRGRGRGGGYGFNENDEERPRSREYERGSGTGRGTEMKRSGAAGSGNWGTEMDEGPLQEPVEGNLGEEEKPVAESGEKKPEEQTIRQTANVDEKKAAEVEDNEMSLDEYLKEQSEKNKSLEAMKPEERKVEPDESFASMLRVEKKNEDDAFMKVGTDKERGKKKQFVEKEEKLRKSLNINEFLKPADGEEYSSPTGRRGRGRGRGDRGGYRGGFVGGYNNTQESSAPRIEDPGQFPTLGRK